MRRDEKPKWMLYGDELYYMGPGREAAITIFLGDAEIILDENGEIYEIIIRNTHKHIDKEDLEKNILHTTTRNKQAKTRNNPTRTIH